MLGEDNRRIMTARAGAAGMDAATGSREMRVLLAAPADSGPDLAARLLGTGAPIRLQRVEREDDLPAALDGGEFDCALIDQRLPAFGAAARIGAWRRDGISLPIVVLMDTTVSGEALRLVEAGASDCLERTEASGDRMLLALNGAIRMRRMEERLASAERQLEQIAMIDPLTRLPGRALFMDRLEQTLLLAQREQRGIALLVLDIVKFNEINQTFGHHAGDRLLEYVAGRLGAKMRGSDTLARIGDDQFAILMPTGADRQGAIAAAQKLNETLAIPFEVGSRSITIGTTVGIALYPNHGSTADQTLRAACNALAAAKREASPLGFPPEERGRDPSTPPSLMHELRRAVQRREFVFNYQPVIDLETRRVCGVEALIRWRHPDRGLIAPDTFIPLAEQIGLIDAITFWELDEAFAQISAWQERGIDLPVSINLSALSIRNPRLVPAIEERLGRWRLAARSLTLEVTESAIIQDAAIAAETLRRLHGIGIAVAIDDFGTGYTSLSYLRKLPFDRIKIDKSFVLGMRQSNDDAIIVRTIVELSRSLGLQVVAEGVEDNETLQTLAAMGCGQAQGFHMGRPMPASALEDWLATSPFGRSRTSGGHRT